ncbi:MAG: hypothetical protein NPIRA03_11170 [Nitrospirales bacterium]|nr:MAG: hypothetical protein NPIRA03_11170 [Nitrospirales bacterium]
MNSRLLLSLMMATCILPVSSALALFDDDKAELLKGTQITLVEAVETAMKTVKGKAVDAELEQEEGKTVFEVKIVDENETTREVYVDAQSGNVVKIEKD